VQQISQLRNISIVLQNLQLVEATTPENKNRQDSDFRES